MKVIKALEFDNLNWQVLRMEQFNYSAILYSSKSRHFTITKEYKKGQKTWRYKEIKLITNNFITHLHIT